MIRAELVCVGSSFGLLLVALLELARSFVGRESAAQGLYLLLLQEHNKLARVAGHDSRVAVALDDVVHRVVTSEHYDIILLTVEVEIEVDNAQVVC